ncbi:hybrid sensor histidine kinase/response regulator [Anaeromyxobacter dehalogenans]|uniref:histidine kinase n=1 Tax=Anaeromyxobacter dehalogenans (strain 2CP-C) TaxID=290397 RepID=Q2IH29_ANADE|nr:ATP-binding protein [Anaeromyxobacter dehalogenans]ABC83885.1 multi-sensor signal transduction histidine kinase [Anaeromyxobacter dehalogenans 2CP-C]
MDGVEAVKILLVDDRPANLLALESALAGAGYELVKAGSGAEALRFLLRDECALILLDVNMPELDGYETARLVRQNPRTRNIPVVFITAYGADERRVLSGYEAGAVDYLFKPVTPELLRSKVAAFVALHRAQRQILAQAEQLRAHERREHALALAQLELQSLRRQEAAQKRYRTLVEGITHALVWVIDPDTLVCRFVSPSAEAILGHPTERWTADAGLFAAALHPADRDRVLASLRAITAGSPGATLQHRFVRADGSEAWFETAARLLPGEDGAGLELRGFSVEVTEVVEGRAALELLSRATAELSTSLDCQDTVARAAAVAVPALGEGCAVEVGADPRSPPVRAVVHVRPEAREALERVARHPALGRGPERGVEVIQDPAGLLDADGEDLARDLDALAAAEIVQVALTAHDQRIGTMHLFTARPARARDLELAAELGRRVAQAVENALLYRRAQEAVELRERFLSIASHELRTPLAALLLQARVLNQLLDTGRIPVPPGSREELQRRVRGAVKQVERLGGLVNSLFDLARIRSGRLALERAPCDLVEIARDVAGRFEDVLALQGRAFTVEAPESLRGVWDRGRVDQVITNLLSNAVKHGASGPVALRVARRGASAEVAVEDAGRGISEADRARIFELFEQGERSAGTGGLGLGLYITRSIAEAHGGRVSVAAPERGGAVFRLELPAGVEEGEREAAPPEPRGIDEGRALAGG